MRVCLGFLIAATTLCASLAGCAPAGYTYDVGSFVPRQASQPTPVSDQPQSPKQSPQTPRVNLLAGLTAPPISNCQAWKEIDRRMYRAPSSGMPQNDFIGDTLNDVHDRGWPEEAAKQLFVVILAAYSEQTIDEDQFVARRFKECTEVAAKPDPKYANVTVAMYWSAEKKAAAERNFQQDQREYMRRKQLLSPCLQYRSKATMVSIYKSKNISIEDAINQTASSAYGPGGIAYRGSQGAEALLTRMVHAGYERDPTNWRDERGQPTTSFGEYAFARCMNGTPF